ncbi:hypothetical protein DFH06DRAFT_1475366 [Mycena polygramma]|nr:hypothetical protein DFH06DRAFT_1475366 [Mycena polygramma]
MTVDPKLPPDLERTIFELAARDHRTMLQIILVAHRCRSWIEPILYRSLVVCQSSWSFPLLLRTIESRPAHYARWIKTLQINPYILPNDPAVTRILSICTGIVHLVDLSYGRTPFSVLSKLRLEKMCLSFDIIEGLTEGAYFSHPAFANLTHLHILDPPQRWPDISFSNLPSLTHLALQNYKTQIRPTNIPVLQKILADCPLLEVLIVFISLCRPQDENTNATKFLVDDRRLVILSRTLHHSYNIWTLECVEAADQTAADGAPERHSNSPWTPKPKATRRRPKRKSKRV